VTLPGRAAEPTAAGAHRPLDGVLPVDKPEGPTSHDVVALARRALRERRIGHTGTLDPFASGLLLLCVGRATRIAEQLTGLPKTYDAVARLGQATDTDDRTGALLHESPGWRELDEARIQAALEAQAGERLQVPPAYSAKKVEGERLYRRARRGETVVPAPVPVIIHRIRLLDVALPEVRFEVECSSGTYIRAIARDLGADLGVGGHLTALRRTRIGAHPVAHALPADQLDDEAAVAALWLAPLDALAHLPRVDLDDGAAAALRHGRMVELPGAPDGLLRVAHDGRLLALARAESGRLYPRKVFGDA
jgi:tRNA pseudouridine55 synthase